MYRKLAKKRDQIGTIKVLIVLTATTHCPAEETQANDSCNNFFMKKTAVKRELF